MIDTPDQDNVIPFRSPSRTAAEAEATIHHLREILLKINDAAADPDTVRRLAGEGIEITDGKKG